jgi:hypothetical protein
MALGSFLFLKEQIKDIIIRDLASEIAVDIFPGDDGAIFFSWLAEVECPSRLGCDVRNTSVWELFGFFWPRISRVAWHFCVR